MIKKRTQRSMSTHILAMHGAISPETIRRFARTGIGRNIILLLFSVLLLFGSFAFAGQQLTARAANPGSGNACSWYRVRWGDTLSAIARRSHTTIGTLAEANYIRNVNLIFVGQTLCLPYRVSHGYSPAGTIGSGVASNGVVRWYDYADLNWSTRPEVEGLLRQAAARYGLPANLLLAIAWQESGWYQHVIARDGGIGVMQLMPYTTMSINAGTRIRRDPYHLVDNIYLGVTYLSWLWHSFGGNLDRVISGYNEGGWAVTHRGIFNWSYVDNVRYLMRVF